MYRTLLQIGPVTLYSYGLMIAVGFVLSTALILREAGKEGISREGIFDVMIAILGGGLIGGRLLFVLINFQFYVEHPLRILFVNEGGMAIQGAMAGGLLAGLLVCKIKKLPFWRSSDIVVPYVALGQAIGRIGCFLNGCCYGYVHEGFCAVTFPGEAVSRFPVQIVYSVALLALFVFLLIVRRKKHFDGFVFLSYLMLYGLLRFSLDFVRGDTLVGIAGITLSQILGLGLFVVGVGLWIVRRKKREITNDKIKMTKEAQNTKTKI